MTIGEKAVKLHDEGCNCAQSVLVALSEYTKLDEATAKALSSGFGGGVRCGEACGAFCGAAMACGAIYFPEDKNGKPSGKTAEMQKKYTEAFVEKYGFSRCEDLVAKYGGKEECNDFIAYSAEMIEKIFKEEV